MSNLPVECVALILGNISLVERMRTGLVSSIWLKACRMPLANSHLEQHDFAKFSLPFARKYAFPYAKVVDIGFQSLEPTDTLPSVEHFSIAQYRCEASLFTQILTKNLNPSKIQTFMNMDVSQVSDTVLALLPLLKNLKTFSINNSRPTFIFEALKASASLESFRILPGIDPDDFCRFLASQTAPVKWKDIQLGIFHRVNEVFALLPQVMPELRSLSLTCSQFVGNAGTLKIEHASLRALILDFSHFQDPHNFDFSAPICLNLPKLTYCRLSSSGDSPRNIRIQTPSLFESLEVRVARLGSLEVVEGSSLSLLKSIHFHGVGCETMSTILDHLLEECKSLETLHIENGSLFSSLSLQKASSPSLKQISIIECSNLQDISLGGAEMLQKLKILVLRKNEKLQSLVLDSGDSCLASLQVIDVSYNHILDLNQLASFCNRATSLQKLIIAEFPKDAFQRALDEFPRLKSVKIEGRCLSDVIWRSKCLEFNKGGVGDPGLYGRRHRRLI